MKRILLLIKGLGRGGAEQLLATAAPHTDRARFAYEVAYLLPHKNALVGELEAAGVEATCLEGATGAGWIRRLRELVVRKGIDLVHVHSPRAAIGAALGLPRGRRAPRVVSTEHIDWGHYGPAAFAAYATSFPRNDWVFAVSEGVRATIRYPLPLRWLRMPPVERLYQGIDLARVVDAGARDGVRSEFGIEEECPLVGTVANFKAHKGLDYLVEAAALVRTGLPDARFLFVGTGPLEGYIRKLVDERGLGGSVIFAGPRDDVPRLCASFDVFALASLSEGLSIAVMEAMALGKAIVVTRPAGEEMLEHGRSALMVPPRDPQGLADSIGTLLADRGLRESFGAAARVRAGDFDITRAVQRMEQVYAELLA